MLSAAGIVALVGQMPGGALVDMARSERLVAGIAISLIGVSALAFAVLPLFPVILMAAVMQALASCVLGPALAAISLGLVGHEAIGERLGRNARYASIGNGVAAAAMGACGYLLSARAVFVVTVLLLVPALLVLRTIAAAEIDPERSHGANPRPHAPAPVNQARRIFPPALLVFAGCLLLFHLANAAMLPLMGSFLTRHSGRWAAPLIAACIVVPQLMVAAGSPWVAAKSQLWGRRPLLMIGFLALTLRGILFAIVSTPMLVVGVQLLDGITAAVLSVLVPLVIADLTRGTGHFNFGQGVVGTGVGIGASISTTLAGYVSDHFGGASAFISLAGIALVGGMTLWMALPETRTEPVFHADAR